MKTISKNTEYKRNCPNCNTTLYYNNTSALNLATRENKVCRKCSKTGTKTKKNHPDTVKRICEWTGDVFEVIWKKRNARFKDIASMYEWRKSQNHEIVNCLNCGNTFDRYKNAIHNGTQLPQQFCSNKCARNSKAERETKKDLFKSSSNPMNNKIYVDNIKKAKLERYGDTNYNNQSKSQATNIAKYGEPFPMLKTSNGKRISKGQRKLYESIKITNSDVILEHYLSDVNLSVDIFIPSKNKVIEYFGDYWHCNPKKYKDDYYHTQVHKTAKEIWEQDKKRIQLLKNNGYGVKVIWESS